MSGGIPKRILMAKTQQNTPFFFGRPVAGGSVSSVGQGRAGRRQIGARISSLPAGKTILVPGSTPFTSLLEIYIAVDEYFSGVNSRKTTQIKKYGYIDNWDISSPSITSLYDSTKGGLFESGRLTQSGSTFNIVPSNGTGNTLKWDTSNITDMSCLFKNCGRNITAHNWDTRNVTSKREMFKNSNYRSEITNWNTSNVTDMEGMFEDSNIQNSDLSTKIITTATGAYIAWDTKFVTTMRNMFRNTNFNGDIDNWNTISVFQMSNMFENTPNFNRDISKKSISGLGSTYDCWNTPNVTFMTNMFKNSEIFNSDIGDWNTSNVQDMTSMFQGAKKFNINLDTWDTSKVVSMASMFNGAVDFNNMIGNWNTNLVITMESMFRGAKNFNENINGWDTSSVQNMSYMFAKQIILILVLMDGMFPL